LVPPSLCTITPGWAQIHQVEADASGNDKFTRQTCVVRDPGGDHQCSMFIPTGVTPTENKVHIFFGPGGTQGDIGNNVPCHALRASVAATDWIVIAVAGINKNGHDLPDLISAAEVLDILDRHGRPKRVDKLRLSCHSRGNAGLTASLTSKRLVAAGAAAPVFPASIVERIVVFDEDGWNTNNAATVAGVNTANLFGFQVNATRWSFSQVVKLVNVPDVNHERLCLKAIVWARLIEDAKVVHPGLTIPADIDTMVTSLGLPQLGLLTSRKTPTAPLQNFQAFCTSKLPIILPATFKTQKLGDFVLAHDLARLGVVFNDPHHFFVAEFAHEVTDALPPEP